MFYKDVKANQFVIPGSNYHMRMSAVARLKSIFDDETWFDVALPDVTADPLKFRDERRYADRIKDARAKTGLNEPSRLAMASSKARPSSSRCRISISWAARSAWPPAEAIVRGLELAVEKKSTSSCSRPPRMPACKRASCR